MLMPQWHTNTPTRESWEATSISSGSTGGTTSAPLDGATTDAALAAAAEADATVSGMSLGPVSAPHANTPGRDVSTGANTPARTNPCASGSTPAADASSRPPAGGPRPVASTTMSNR